MTRISLIAAVARNGVIGRGDGCRGTSRRSSPTSRPRRWDTRSSWAARRSSRSGGCCPGAAPSSSPATRSGTTPGSRPRHSFPEAVSLAGPADEVFVAGGAQIYAEALPYAHRMLITEVDAEPEGDT